MTDSPTSDRDCPISLGGLDEFVKSAESGDLDEEDRTVDRNHPLTIVVENTLESLTRLVNKEPILGFSRASENKLALKRRALENQGTKPELQHLLYSYERLSKIIREAGYGASDPVADAEILRRDDSGVASVPRRLGQG